MSVKKTGIQSIILVGYKGERENFEEVSSGTTLGWWRRYFAKGPIRVKTSVEYLNAGIRAFCVLTEVPIAFSRISIPLTIDDKEQLLPLIVLNVTQARNLSSPFVVRCAFDFGYTKGEMEACTEEDRLGRKTEVTAKWVVRNIDRLVEVFQLIRAERIKGVEKWSKRKVIPVSI